MEKALELILAKIESVEAKIESVEAKMESVEAKIDNVDRNQIEMNKTLNNKIDDLEKNLNSRMDTLDGNISGLKNSLVEGLEPYFSNVEKQIDENNSKLSSDVAKQKNIIGILSSRSIQHEADIKALNEIVRNQ
ncbi:hypothetical protein ACXYMX_16405 [Sporosarcina sp. CAU 1771]